MFTIFNPWIFDIYRDVDDDIVILCLYLRICYNLMLKVYIVIMFVCFVGFNVPEQYFSHMETEDKELRIHLYKESWCDTLALSE